MKYIIHYMLFLLCFFQAGAQNIVQMEYFIDVDNGFGNAIPVTGFTVQPDIANFSFPIPVNLSQGIHTVGIRSKDANGTWGLTNFFPINVLDSSNGVITQIEYFWDTDPGFGNGMDTILSVPVADLNSGMLYAHVPLTLSGGSHILYVRSKESRERWSHTNHTQNITVSIAELSELPDISINPNPVIDKITVTSENNHQIRFIIYDSQGQLVLEKVIHGKTGIDVSSYANGIYTVFVWVEENKIYRSIVIKQ